MLNKDLHRTAFINALDEIYSDPQIRTLLGFKGGTAAMLFYELPRFSVDLDFDLLDQNKKDLAFAKLKEILPKVGRVDQAQDKYYTLFFLIDYKKGERNLKIEISKRPSKAEYDVKNYLGLPMLVMKEDDMAAGKLAALTTRKRFATRDMFDAWYFLRNSWPIDEQVLKEKTGFSLPKALKTAQKRIMTIKKTEILYGLGELLDNKQKAWAKEKLQEDLLFQLRLRESFEKK